MATPIRYQIRCEKDGASVKALRPGGTGRRTRKGRNLMRQITLEDSMYSRVLEFKHVIEAVISQTLRRVAHP
jgi:hypothetical protein